MRKPRIKKRLPVQRDWELESQDYEPMPPVPVVAK